MRDWCQDAFTIGAWAMHGHTEKRGRTMAVDYLRFYFANAADAAAFQAQWAND
jgi:hypothetical protein